MTARELRYVVRPGGAMTGDVRVPGDKSISHRAVILGSIADGASRITGILEGTDVLATIDALRKMGVPIRGPEQNRLHIQGVGLNGLSDPGEALNLGNSGTAMRLLSGLLAGQRFTTTLVGDESLSRRPMRRVTEPLGRMGARLQTAGNGTPPLSIRPADRLEGIHYVLPMPSAQVKSAILLAGLYAHGRTCVDEPVPTRDHTERMLSGFGYAVDRTAEGVCLSGGGTLVGTDVDVPADISSAAFFMVAAAIAPGSSLHLSHVGVNPTRTGIVDILRGMGAAIDIRNERLVCGEPVADIVVNSSPLIGIEVPPRIVPLAIDEFPIICIAAACAAGTTTIRGAAELRHKESDRISAMVTGLTRLGIDAEELDDGMRIRGGELAGGWVDSCGDHRIAMAFCMAGLRSRSPLEVRDCGNIATSFPDFPRTASTAGLHIDKA